MSRTDEVTATIDLLREAVEDGKLVWGAVPPGRSTITVADLQILDPTDPAAWNRTFPLGILLCWEFRFVLGWAWTVYDLTHLGAMGENAETFLYDGALDDPQAPLDLCLAEIAGMDQQVRQWRHEEVEVGTIFAKYGTPRDALSVFFSDWLHPQAGILATGTPAEVTAKISANLASRLDTHRRQCCK